MIRSTLAILLLSATPVLCQDHVRLPNLPVLYDVTRVGASDTLNIREKPNGNSPVVGQLGPNATSIEVVGYSSDGDWATISNGETMGWISTDFIKETNVAVWWELSTPLNCYGTEPFWNMSFSPGSLSNFQDAGENETILTQGWLTETWGRPDWGQPINAALSFTSPNGPALAVLRSEQCDDGMSDQEFHLSVTFLMRDQPPHTGCCSLMVP